MILSLDWERRGEERELRYGFVTERDGHRYGMGTANVEMVIKIKVAMVGVFSISSITLPRI